MPHHSSIGCAYLAREPFTEKRHAFLRSDWLDEEWNTHDFRVLCLLDT